jgi:membrane-associated phospholipid phosphatase
MQRLARALSVLFHPMVYATLYLAALATARGASWARPCAEAWLLLVVAPALLLLWGMRRGLWSDPDLTRLRERRTFVPWVAACGGAAAGLAYLSGFPHGLRLSLLAIFTWLGLTAVISLGWKISLHVGAVTGVLALVALLFGLRPTAALVWTPPAVAWARLYLRRHTPAQVAAGAALGALSVALAAALAGG